MKTSIKFKNAWMSDNFQRIHKMLENRSHFYVSRIEEENTKWIYHVVSLKTEKRYIVTISGNDINCSCPDFKFNKKLCKHIWYVIDSENLPESFKIFLLANPEILNVLELKK